MLRAAQFFGEAFFAIATFLVAATAAFLADVATFFETRGAFLRSPSQPSWTTLSKLAAEIARPHISGFTVKRGRSGVETALAAARISRDDRGHLQSHGITGVQARHYDGHDYLDAKRDGLDLLYLLLTKRSPRAKHSNTD